MWLVPPPFPAPRTRRYSLAWMYLPQLEHHYLNWTTRLSHGLDQWKWARCKTKKGNFLTTLPKLCSCIKISQSDWWLVLYSGILFSIFNPRFQHLPLSCATACYFFKSCLTCVNFGDCPPGVRERVMTAHQEDREQSSLHMKTITISIGVKSGRKEYQRKRRRKLLRLEMRRKRIFLNGKGKQSL